LSPEPKFVSCFPSRLNLRSSFPLLRYRARANGYEFRGDSEHAQTDEDRRCVFRAIQEAGSGTRTDLSELTGLPGATVARHGNDLREDGKVDRTGSGRKGDPYVWHAETGSAKRDSLAAETKLFEDGER
jgi:predicted HTH transcriptional regulator